MKQVRLSFFFPLTIWRRGVVVLQNSLSTECMAPVSKRKEMNHPGTRMSTQGSLSEMVVVGFKRAQVPSGPRRSGAGQSVFDGLVTGSAWR